MPLVLAGATSGQATLQATDAQTVTITLPATSGTLVTTGGAQTIEFADGSAAAPSITNSGDTNTGMFFPAADTIAFTEGGVESMRIDASGNLGIGTASPASRLSVTGSANIATFDGGANTSITLTGSNRSDVFLIDSGAATDQKRLTIRSDGGNLIFGVENDAVTTFTERMRIDSSGRVTMPFQPAFLVGSSLGDATISAGNVVAFDTVSFNTGSNFSTGTGRFTAPVAGRYQFNFLAYFTSSGGNTQSMQIAPYLNGSQIMVGGDAILFVANTPNVTSIICIGGSVTLNLAANDYVTANARGTNARLYMGHTKFSGYLIG